MNVYDMDIEPNDKWARFYTRHNLAMPGMPLERPAFFTAHPQIAVMRNNKNIPRGTKQKLGDYSNLSHDIHPVFSERARQLLAPHLQGLGQWIELTSEHDPTYWLFYITNVVDALDEAQSELLRFKDGGVMRIAGYAFKPEAVRDQWLFTLPQRPGCNRCVTDRFVDLVRQNGLTGFEFTLLWSEEAAASSKAA